MQVVVLLLFHYLPSSVALLAEGIQPSLPYGLAEPQCTAVAVEVMVQVLPLAQSLLQLLVVQVVSI